ncbi:complement component C8 gamma chain isoform X2 [Emydura macquarii macquarii]|uniref:complement component C8 gamma chain isoform X2 n=1 Tax=Emydura macquarii macquarii TaxID=1129001 RepID=UPI003529E4E1
MASTAPILLLVLLLASRAPGQRRQRPPAPESPLEKVAIQENFDLQQFAGKWFLVGVASKCDYLREYNHQLEATTMVVSASEGTSLAVSTFRKLDGVCWEIKQQYRSTKAQGRFLLKGRGSSVDVVVGETDYSSYAILYYQKLRKISIKLYGRKIRVSDAIVSKFEQRVTEMNMSEDFTYYFPTYGFCESADQFHLLDGELQPPKAQGHQGLVERMGVKGLCSSPLSRERQDWGAEGGDGKVSSPSSQPLSAELGRVMLSWDM